MSASARTQAPTRPGERPEGADSDAVIAGRRAADEFVAVRPFLKRHNGTLLVMISTLAAASMIQGAAQLTFGPQNRQIPPMTDAVFRIGNVWLATTSLIGFGLAMLLIVGLIVLLKRTEWGATIRAVEQNRDMALLIGIQPKPVYAAVFGCQTSARGGRS
jgi:branched-chain amino acid transport system permease protein